MTKLEGRKPTLFVVLNILLIILYSAMRAETTSLLGIAMWGSFIIPIVLCASSKQLRKFIPWLLVLIFYFAIHLLLADSSPLTMATYCLTILYYFVLEGLEVQHDQIRKLFILLILVCVVADAPGVYLGLFSNRYTDAFQGIFENPNTCSFFLCISFFVFISLRSQSSKVSIWMLVALLVLILATKSRNSILFIALFSAFYILYSRGWRRLVPYVFVILWIGALYFLLVIEPQGGFDLEMMGKKSTSAGRSLQVLLTIRNFPLTLFGVGVDVPGSFSIQHTGYSIHNAHINTLYSMGIAYIAIYIAFVVRIYQKMRDFKGPAFLLAINMYAFFEPGMLFSPLMLSSLPLIILICYQKKL